MSEEAMMGAERTEAERDAAQAYSQGRQAGLRLLSVEMCPLGGALAEWWRAGRMAGLAERLLNDNARMVGRDPPTKRDILPSFDDLRGIAPDATGDESAEDFVRKFRHGWV